MSTSSEEVVTHSGVDRGYRICRCHQCGHESRCTPDNDFYTKGKDGPLYCEKCIHADVPVVDLTKPKPQLEFFPSLGEQIGVGWLRDDMPGIVHMFASVLPGERFKARNGEGGPHWPCEVCNAYGYTENDFHEQVTALSKKMRT